MIVNLIFIVLIAKVCTESHEGDGDCMVGLVQLAIFMKRAPVADCGARLTDNCRTFENIDTCEECKTTCYFLRTENVMMVEKGSIQRM